jgi:hypothetical protein
MIGYIVLAFVDLPYIFQYVNVTSFIQRMKERKKYTWPDYARKKD